MNRILPFLSSRPCQCCRVREMLKRLEDETHRIQEDAAIPPPDDDGNADEFEGESVLVFILPEPLEFDADSRGESPEINLLLRATLSPAALDADLRAHAIKELRRAAETLTAAADRLEGTKGTVTA
ncbi:MAG: hypothetical protein EXS05_20630 [Planctomycetaceae bacterium]|nr:hypothetical protein [Planctomycetaceae bacterium]